MTTIKRIITHAGSAHADELVACSLALALHPSAQLERTFKVSDQDLSDPETLVLDVGGVYDPESRCFDHHQDNTLDSAAVLYIRDVFPVPVRTIHRAFPWLVALSAQDTKGPGALVSEYHLTDTQALTELRGPYLQFMLTRLVAKDTELLQDFGEFLVREMNLVKRARMHEIEYSRFMTHNGLYLIDLRGIKPEVSRKMDVPEYWDYNICDGREPGTVSIIANTAKGAKVFDPDNPKPGALFTHASGFMAVFPADTDPVSVLP